MYNHKINKKKKKLRIVRSWSLLIESDSSYSSRHADISEPKFSLIKIIFKHQKLCPYNLT